jgi:hypothetical protein
MNKVYRHKKLAPDQYIGNVIENGKVFEARFGPDKHAGRVDLDSGKVYEARFGPDKYIGRVDLSNGKIYLPRLGPDDYLGRVAEDGRCYLHKRLARDEYIGKVTDMASYAHGGAGFLLLLMPLLEKIAEEIEEAGQAREEAPTLNDDELPAGAET